MLTLRHPSPFDLLRGDLRETDLFQKLEQQLQTAERVPAAEVREVDGHYAITLELPGVDRSSIDVKATDRTVVISAQRKAPGSPAGVAPAGDPAGQPSSQAPLVSEFRYGTWSRSFRFPSGINREGLRASYRDGLLQVTAPKTQAVTSVSVEVEG